MTFHVTAAYARLNEQPAAADWGATEIYQFLLGEGLTPDEARDLAEDVRDGERIVE